MWEVEYTLEFEEWYKTAVPTADDLYDTHLEELQAERLLDGSLE